MGGPCSEGSYDLVLNDDVNDDGARGLVVDDRVWAGGRVRDRER